MAVVVVDVDVQFQKCFDPAPNQQTDDISILFGLAHRAMNFLASDITKQPNFPQNAIGQRAKAAHRRYIQQGETLFQITTLQNCSRSLVDQLDEILANEDAEGVGADRLRFGNRLVREVNVEDEDANASSSINNTTSLYKLTLQDCEGNYIFAIEEEKLPFLAGKNMRTGFPISQGAKLLVKNPEESHGCLMLRPDTCEYLGGGIPEWNVDLAKRHVTYLRGELDKL